MQIPVSSHAIMNTTSVLMTLHWLPVSQRVKYKHLLLTFKAFQRILPIVDLKEAIWIENNELSEHITLFFG